MEISYLRQRGGWFIIGIIIILGMGIRGVGAGAANGGILVNSTVDAIADDGVCTLREAVIAANRDLPSGTMAGECAAGGIDDLIVLPSGGYAFSIAGAFEDESATGDLDIVGQVRIVGQGSVVIDAAGLDRVLQVLPSGNLTVEGLTLQGGIAPDGISGSTPTVGQDGGGILSQGTLSLYSTTVQNNRAGNGGNGVSQEQQVHGGRGGYGGGIAHISDGSLIVVDSTISGNRTGTGGNGGNFIGAGGHGGWGGDGGGIYLQQVTTATLSSGTILLAETVISANQSQRGGNGGGGGAGNGGNGGAGGSGGGIYLNDTDEVVHILASEISTNQSGFGGFRGSSGGAQYGTNGLSGAGGGIRLTTNSLLTVEASLISANINSIGVGNNGGGIASSGMLVIRDSVIESNQAGPGRGSILEGPNGEPGGHGGGIYQEAGAIFLLRTEIDDNRGGTGGAGQPTKAPGRGGDGGGIYTLAGMLEIRESTIAQNRAGKGGFNGGRGGDGGGLFINGELLMVNSTIEANRSGEGGYEFTWSGKGGSGGGMMVGSTGSATILQSLIAHNIAVAGSEGNIRESGDGGGIAVRGTMTMENSTVSGNNTATIEPQLGFSGNGGGIFGDTSSAITLTHTTIAENFTGQVTDKGESGRGGGIYTLEKVVSDNILLANNSSEALGADCDGTIAGLGYNLIEDSTACTITGTTTGNILGQEPLLQPLADNGGATQSYALGVNSPAWDAGNCSLAIVTDQRGYPRPIDFPEYPTVANGCDIGAFEAQGVQIDPNLIAVTEGGDPHSYQVTLMRPPTASVTITLAITTQITVSPTLLVFSTGNWTLPQTVTVEAVDDSDLEEIMVVTVGHTATSSDPFYAGVAVGAAQVEIRDNEVPELPTPTPSPTGSNTPTATATAIVPPSHTPTATPIITPSPTHSVTVTPTGSSLRIQYLPLIRRQ